MKIETKIKIGNLTALISFVIGTIIFLAYVNAENDDLIIFGFYFLFIAGIVNFSILFWLLFQTSNDHSIRKRLNRSKLLIVANIPIALVYFIGVMTLMSNLRITFVNITGALITNIRIIGCETATIHLLDQNEKTTKWIGINGDCSVDIKYLINGEEKHETVVGYASGPMGQRLKHEIGIDEAIF